MEYPLSTVIYGAGDKIRSKNKKEDGRKQRWNAPGY